MPENGDRPRRPPEPPPANHNIRKKTRIGNPVECIVQLVLPDLGLEPVSGLIPLVHPQHLHVLGLRHPRQPSERLPLAALKRDRVPRRRSFSHLVVVHGA